MVCQCLAGVAMNIALFDFDGTVTLKDTFVPFLVRSTGVIRRTISMVMLSPFILGYKLGFVPATQMRSLLARSAYACRSIEEVEYLGARFAAEQIPHMLRQRAIDRIGWHMRRGDKIVIVSAALDAYLVPWCREHGLELVCTQLERNGNRLTGRYLNGDCSGDEKVHRVLQNYDLNGFAEVYAYGDTIEDVPMLKIASRKFFRWIEIQSVEGITSADFRVDEVEHLDEASTGK